MKHLLLLLFILRISTTLAQHQDRNWYFGDGTDGIIFNAQNVPVKVSNKYPGVGFEGMAIASDPCSGDLLFYTDGITVINKNHNVMANGTGLLANMSGSQCVQICKKPGTCSEYYVISNSSFDNTPGSFYYSIVDFGSNPLGQVTAINQYINGPNYHQAMRIIPKTNSNNYWLIGHLYNTATYHVFEITSAGFTGPVVYNFANSGRSWTMEYNTVTRKLVNMGQDNLKVSLFDFDPATGIISNEQQLYSGTMNAMVGNFSPDGSKLYAGLSVGVGAGVLWQYDFNTSAWTNMNTCCWAHDVKTGPDGITYYIHTYNALNPLSQMTDANLTAVGNACGYSTITNPGNFNGEVRRFPEFLQIPDPPVANLDAVTILTGSIILNPLSNDYDPQGDTISLTSILSGPNYGTAVINGNQINYTSTSGSCIDDSILYSITDNTCMCDTAYIIIHHSPAAFTIQSTQATCQASDGTVTVNHTGGVGGFSYQWNPPNDTTLSSISGLISGSYSVIATDLGTGCSQSLSTIVGNSAGITATITSSSNVFCQNDDDGSATVIATGGQPPYLYLWPNGDTTSTTNHLSNGTHIVMVEDYDGCSAYASVTIGYTFPAPVVELGQDTIVCIGTPYIIDAGPGSISYLWNDNTTGQTLTVNSTGLYSVLVTDSNGCQNFDAVQVTFVTCLGPLGISSIDELQARVYPNPAFDEINISFYNKSESKITIMITDIFGKQVYYNRELYKSLSNKKINLKNYQDGVYFLKIESKEVSITEKIIKQ